MKKILIVFFFYFLAVAPSFAKSTLHLKSGEKVEGDIIERTDDYVKVNLEGVDLTYWSDQIENIEMDEKDGQSPSDEVVVTEEAVQVPLVKTAGSISRVSTKDASGNEFVPSQKIFVKETEEPVDAGSSGVVVDVVEEEASSWTDVQQARPKVESSIFAPSSTQGLAVVRPDMGKKGQPQMTPEQARAAAIAIFTVATIIGILAFLFFAFCLQLIATKTNTPNAWLAWIPVANLYLMCKVAGKPVWWLLCFFVPFLNIVFMILLWMGIAEARKKPGWLGLLMLVPVANIAIPVYLAFSE